MDAHVEVGESYNLEIRHTGLVYGDQRRAPLRHYTRLQPERRAHRCWARPGR
jgi:hypothetical protein